MAADAELRRRHPGIRLEPLRGHTQPAPEQATAPRSRTGPRQPGPAEPIPVTDAEIAAAAARLREHPAPDPAQAARWRAEQTARIDADRQARAEAAARACPVTDAEIAKYGGERQEPEKHPARRAGQDGPGTAHEAKMDQIHQQVRRSAPGWTR